MLAKWCICMLGLAAVRASKCGLRLCEYVVQVQVSKGGAGEGYSSSAASASAMVSSLMSLKASPALVAAFLRTQPGTSPYIYGLLSFRAENESSIHMRTQ